jgi:hypothetical protein
MVRNVSVSRVKTPFNSIRNGSSERLKWDFEELIGSLLDTKKRPIISAPVPSLGRGSERCQQATNTSQLAA